MRTEKATKTITQSGDSLVINVTKEVKRLGLGRGDDVDITLSSAMGDDLAFIVRAMTNALIAHEIEIDDNNNLHGASVDLIARLQVALGEIAPPSLTIASDPTHDDHVTIEVYDKSNNLLVGWWFIIDQN